MMVIHSDPHCFELLHHASAQYSVGPFTESVGKLYLNLENEKEVFTLCFSFTQESP